MPKRFIRVGRGCGEGDAHREAGWMQSLAAARPATKPQKRSHPSPSTPVIESAKNTALRLQSLGLAPLIDLFFLRAPTGTMQIDGQRNLSLLERGNAHISGSFHERFPFKTKRFPQGNSLRSFSPSRTSRVKQEKVHRGKDRSYGHAGIRGGIRREHRRRERPSAEIRAGRLATAVGLSVRAPRRRLIPRMEIE
ncbi:hypothetical protein MRX96_025552 [Rhipicephalus microplus]